MVRMVEPRTMADMYLGEVLNVICHNFSNHRALKDIGCHGGAS